MNIVFKKTLLDRILRAVDAEAETGRIIERILLTRQELAELSALPTPGVDSRLTVMDGEFFIDSIPVDQIGNHSPANRGEPVFSEEMVGIKSSAHG